MTIERLNFGHEGQEVVFIMTDTVTFRDTYNLKIAGGTWTADAGDTIRFVNDGLYWYERSRSSN
jgi:hypothetical protein